MVRTFGVGVLPMAPAALQLESMQHRDMNDDAYNAHIERLRQDVQFPLFACAMSCAFEEMLDSAGGPTPITASDVQLQENTTVAMAQAGAVSQTASAGAVALLQAFASEPSLERLQSPAHAPLPAAL
jgi:hypothetical protein